MYLYRTIISQSIKTTWRNKYLWFFGLFAALLGNSGEYQMLFHRFDSVNEGLFPGFKKIIDTGIFSKSALINLRQLAVEEPFSLFIFASLMLIIIIVSAFLIWLSISSQAALVNNSARIKTSKHHNLKDGLEVGIKKFWPVFLLNIILKAIIYIIFLLLSLPVMASVMTQNFTKTGIIFIVSFLVYLPVAIVLSFIIKYSVAYVVVKGEKVINSLKMGWQLFVKNWLISLEMAFLLFFINFMVALILLLLMLVFSVPFLFIVLILVKAGLGLYTWAILVIAFIIYFFAVLLTGAFLSAFQINAWTSLFIELIGRGGVSKLHRVFGK